MIRTKTFITSLLLAGSLISGAVYSKNSDMATEKVKSTSQPKVIFFDVNETLLDLGNVGKSVSEALGGRDELVPYWFTTMLHYSLVGNVMGEYNSFGEIGIASLEMIANQQNITLTPEQARTAVLTPFRDLEPHNDVVEGLKKIRALGYTMITLTNSSDAGIAAQLKNSDLAQYFDGSLTVQNLSIFKPDLRVYEWAQQQMKVAPEDAMLIAAHAWDIAGADKAGWKTAFILRPGKALYPLADKPDLTGKDLIEIANQLEKNN
jgi:2-haloacid dehalogenase